MSNYRTQLYDVLVKELAIVAIASSTLIVGCGLGKQDFPATLKADTEFTDDQLVLFQSAIDSWREATHGRANIVLRGRTNAACTSDEVGSEDTPVLYACGPNDSKLKDVEKENSEPVLSGFADTGHVALVIDRLTTDRMFHATSLHELGHFVGLPHSQDPHSLMYPTNHVDYIDQGTVDAFNDLYDSH